MLDRHEWAMSEGMADNYLATEEDFLPIIVDPQRSIIDGIHRLNAAIGQGKPISVLTWPRNNRMNLARCSIKCRNNTNGHGTL